MIARRTFLTGLAAPLLCACSLPTEKRGEIRSDIVGGWACIDSNESPVLIGATLELQANGHFRWQASAESNEFPEELDGRWGYDPENSELSLAEPVGLLRTRPLYYDLRANVAKEPEAETMTLSFFWFSDYGREVPIVLTFARKL